MFRVGDVVMFSVGPRVQVVSELGEPLEQRRDVRSDGAHAPQRRLATVAARARTTRSASPGARRADDDGTRAARTRRTPPSERVAPGR